MSFSENSSDSDWKEAKRKVKLNSSSGGSASGKQKYSQKFCEKWLSLFEPWLKRSAEDPNKPFCRACQCRLDCNRCHLVRHERTTKHKRNLESLITNGEGAVRKELSVRQERSKYYHQRKRALKVKLKQEVVESEPLVKENNQLEVINTDGVVEDSSHNLQVIESSTNNNRIPTTIKPVSDSDSTPASSNRKEGLKLLMQIQQDKNELMESFRELIGVQLPHAPPPRDKNHVDLFFESVSSSVKALSPKLVAEAKMRVSQLICELELRALNDNSGSSNGVEIPIPMTTTPSQTIAEQQQQSSSHHQPQFGAMT
ncbi:hypothetical protein ACLKA7_005333 [Drosophila subpalustris]